MILLNLGFIFEQLSSCICCNTAVMVLGIWYLMWVYQYDDESKRTILLLLDSRNGIACKTKKGK